MGELIHNYLSNLRDGSSVVSSRVHKRNKTEHF